MCEYEEKPMLLADFGGSFGKILTKKAKDAILTLFEKLSKKQEKGYRTLALRARGKKEKR